MEKTVGEFIDRNGDVRFRRWLHEILYDQWQCVKREVLSIFVTTENDVTRWREGGWKIQIKMEKAQIIPLKYSESLDNPLKYFLVHLPLNYVIRFNLPLDTICPFCFSMHKWSFKFKFSKFILDSIRYFLKI
jgi:hypothetical protein